MSGHKTCRCGQPITDGAHLCATCVERFRRDLERIADRWNDLTDALSSSEVGPREMGRQKRGAKVVGTQLNESVSRAMKQCREVVWFAAQVIREDCDDASKDFRLPRNPTTEHLARWMLRWQVPHLTAVTAEETALEIADDLARAERATFKALDPPRWVVVTGCTVHTTDDLGRPCACEGTLWAKVGAGVMPDLECDMDASHVISPGTWERQGWKRRFGRPLDEGGLRRLAERMRS